MPPKTPKTPNSDGDGPAPKASDIITLCKVMETCDTLNIDNKAAGEKIQMLAKNVPRKINQIVNPYGFEFKNGKISAVSGDDVAAPATPSAAVAINEDSAPQTPASNKKATSKKASTPKSVKTPRKNKKRKVDPEDDETVIDGAHANTEIHDQNGEMIDGTDAIEGTEDVEAEQEDVEM